MNKTNIEYLDYSWNPTHGCSPISPGCAHCWAEATSKSMARIGIRGYSKENPFAVTCCPWKLDEPLKVKKPSRIGVSFMGDLFHEDVPFEFIGNVLEVFHRTPQHTYIVLTKRIDRPFHDGLSFGRFPNVWLGVTAENQEQADKRIPILLQIPAAKHFVSFEPLLEWVELPQWHLGEGPDWFIVGGESGQKRRPVNLSWISNIVDMGYKMNIPVFVKQIEVNGKLSKKPAEWPEYLRVQEFPG